MLRDARGQRTESGHAAALTASDATTWRDTGAITARLPRPLTAAVWDLPRAARSCAKGRMLTAVAAAVTDTRHSLVINQ